MKRWIATGLTVIAAAVGAFTLWVPREAPAPAVAAAPRASSPDLPQPQPTAALVAAPTDPERQLFALAEASLSTNPSKAIELARQGDAEFPRGPLADERQLLKLRARVNLNEIPEARVDATNYLEQNPHSPLAPRIHRLLGIHPPPKMGPGN